jgi:hypothetical protein
MRKRAIFAFDLMLATIMLAGAANATPAATRTQGTKYISKHYGYEITLRGKYTMIPATGLWDGSFPFGSSGSVDVIVDDTQDRKFIVAAKPVPSRMSLTRWEAFVEGVKRQACGGLRHFQASSLGGEPAREFVNSCPGYEVITLAALHKRRGYILEYLSATSFSAAADRRVYEAGRRAFAFTQK